MFRRANFRVELPALNGYIGSNYIRQSTLLSGDIVGRSRNLKRII